MTRQAAVDAQRKLADVKRQQQQQQTEAAGTKAAGLVRVTDEDQSEQQAARVSGGGGAGGKAAALLEFKLHQAARRANKAQGARVGLHLSHAAGVAAVQIGECSSWERY